MTDDKYLKENCSCKMLAYILVVTFKSWLTQKPQCLQTEGFVIYLIFLLVSGNDGLLQASHLSLIRNSKSRFFLGGLGGLEIK